MNDVQFEYFLQALQSSAEQVVQSGAIFPITSLQAFELAKAKYVFNELCQQTSQS